MFNAIRFALAILITIALIIVVKNKKVKKTLIVINAVLYLVISIFPYENIFFRFKTLEDSYQYSFGDQANIVQAYERGDCALVFHPKSDGIIFTIFSKDNRGWKITPPSNYTKQKTYELQDDLRVFVKKATKSKRLIIVTDLILNGEAPRIHAISDSLDSKFLTCELKYALGVIVYHFTFAEWNESEYQIKLNGMVYEIEEW